MIEATLIDMSNDPDGAWEGIFTFFRTKSRKVSSGDELPPHLSLPYVDPRPKHKDLSIGCLELIQPLSPNDSSREKATIQFDTFKSLVKEDNIRFIRTFHPTLASFEYVWVIDFLGHKMWVVRGSGTIQHTHACGMEIHLRPRGEGRYVAMGRSYPCLLYSRHLPSIWGIPYGVFNPRQILKPVDLAVIRFHRPKSVSVRVLFSGFVVIMFRTKKQRKKAEMELVHEVQGLTCQVDCSKAVPITNIGAKVLPGRNIVSSLIEALCENILNREKPLKPRYAEMTKECATNGQQECPTINGWASNKEVLEGGQIFTCKVKMTDPRIQSSHETRGEVVSADLGGCIVDGLEYFWGKSKENIGLESCSVLWRTVNNDAVEVVQNDIYTVLCLGNPTGRFVKAVVIQDYEVRSELSETVRYDHHDDVLQRKSKEYPFCHPIMRGGFLLPQDVRKSGILLKGTE